MEEKRLEQEQEKKEWITPEFTELDINETEGGLYQPFETASFGPAS